jgi:DNA-binding NtrC family response regulator
LNQKKNILLVDDDPAILSVLETRLVSAGLKVFIAGNGPQALEILNDHHVDVLVSDVKMPGMNGMELLEKVRSIKPELPVIFMTAYGTIPDAVSSVKAGVVDYLSKPLDGRDLIEKLHKIVDTGKVQRNKCSHKSQSPAMKELFGLVGRISYNDVNLLILGESGVGKEWVARYIHRKGLRGTHPFVVVDCGSMPAGLLESELFGHIRGSFTHAVRDKKGLIEMAEKGTLFLDEIGNITPETQIRLLRFLEDRKIRKIGDTQEFSVDCRIIAATNADLEAEVAAGRFREDLYYRLRVVSLVVPPLRDRKEDISTLARLFVARFSKRHRVTNVEILPETLKRLEAYSWPGNIRELKNVLEAGVVLCKNGILGPEILDLKADSEVVVSRDSLSLEENERTTILQALKQTNGNRKESAKLLGISRRSIHYKIKKFEIEPSEIED